MNLFIEKTPFSRLLFPVIVGILLGNLLSIPVSISIGLLGIFLIIFSSFIAKKHRYALRWVFGVSVFLFFVSVSSIRYHDEVKKRTFSFPDSTIVCKGIVLDIPKRKERSVACHVQLSYPQNKKVVLYLSPDNKAENILPGEEILLTARLRPFQNRGNPDDFDYARFMHIKGFSATAFVPAKHWKRTGKISNTPYVYSQRMRKKALDFYRTLELSHDTFSFLAAITLGFRTELSEDIQQSFRASGTAHVLAVSGLHIGMIFLILELLFFFLNATPRLYQWKYGIILLLLWVFVFIAGLMPSAVRAAIMLSIFCIGRIQQKSGFNFNTLMLAAFLMLLYQPFRLFDIGFQMSFGAVAAILYFQPLFGTLALPGKFLRYTSELFIVSLCAQLGVFPIVLYHFGTFPVYFFISNLLLVPLMGIILYTSVPFLLFSLLRDIGLFSILSQLLKLLVQWLVNLSFYIVQMIEALPYSEIKNQHISFVQAVMIFIFLFAFSRFWQKKKPMLLIVSQIAMLLFLCTSLLKTNKGQVPSIVIFNTPNKSDISVYANNERHYMPIKENGCIPHSDKRIVRLSQQQKYPQMPQRPLAVDILILSHDANFSLKKLLDTFDTRTIIIDTSVPRFAAQKLVKEGEKMNIEVHDIAQMGAYSINF